ncbi:hypothetical protein [Chelativorans oligotrophicus]|uniref:hypothetical protein n=1 Tax=Chelativorans oligotrophicus TaxID=449974 RepID=UPI00140A2F10|nr:hypothetical protein [Chelativorans oligotrophicus]
MAKDISEKPKLYAKRPDPANPGLWEVYYVSTGKVIVTDGPQSALESFEADELLDLLEARLEEDY